MNFTYSDSLEHAVDYLGGTPDALALRDVRRAVLSAYRELVNVRTWSYLFAHDRVLTSAPYQAGTVAYDHTGGTYERQLLLYGGTFPAWAGPGAKVRVGVVTHDVQERKSDTVLTFTDRVNPGVDFDFHPMTITGVTLAAPIVLTSVAHGLESGDVVIVESVASSTILDPVVSANGTWTVTRLDADSFALRTSDGTADTPWAAGTGTWRSPPTTSYTLYRDDYLLPADFIKGDTAIFEGNFGGLTYSDPTDQLWFERSTYSSGTPRFYCIRGAASALGRLAIGFFPYPDQAKSIDFIYQRRPRELRWAEVTVGTLTVTGPEPTIAAGSGTNFDATMAGSVLRLGTATVAPTSWIGSSPPAQEVRVVEVLSPTRLRLESSLLPAAGVKYVLSDPVDIEPGAMLTAFLRGVEKQLAVARSIQNKPDAFAAYTESLREAMAADSRSYQGRAMGPRRDRSVPYKYHPADYFPGGR